MTSGQDPAFSAEDRATQHTYKDGVLVDLIHLKTSCRSADGTIRPNMRLDGTNSRKSFHRLKRLYQFVVGKLRTYSGLKN